MKKINIHKIINLRGKEIKPKDMVHFRPFTSTWNVRCLNGSYHAARTTNIEHVTCPKCLNPKTAKDFWFDYEQKHGNVDKVM